MKLSTSTSELLGQLQTVSRVASTRSAVQALSGVQIAATDGAVELRATDMEVGLRVPLDARVERTGTVVLPARLLLDVVRTLRSGELVRVVPGVRHHFSIPKEVPAHFLILFSPGGLQGYFRELNAIVNHAPTYPLPDMRPVIAEKRSSMLPKKLRIVCWIGFGV